MKKRGGKYGWIQPGVRVRVLHCSEMYIGNDDESYTLCFRGTDCDTGMVVRTWRDHGHKRMAEVDLDPPNFGMMLVLATEVERVAD